MTSEGRLAELAASFNVETTRPAVNEAEVQRQETLSRYPREAWPHLDLRDYAVGQADRQDTLCRWMEFQTPYIGSIRGGSSRKLIIYKHRDKPGWYHPPQYDDEQEAWRAVRKGFVDAIGLGEQERWPEIEGLEPLHSGAALLLKVLWTHFPDELLPICSREHLRQFLRDLGDETGAVDQALGPVQLNRRLLAGLRELPAFGDQPTKTLERFLYRHFSPFQPEVYKIAPGPGAELWEECRTEGFIGVGWEKLGDLREFSSKAEFVERYHALYDEESGRKATEKANELWTFLEIEEGHLIAANQGTGRILGLGKVVEPGYEYDGSRDRYPHLLRVEWDGGYAPRSIPPQKRWAFVTISRLQAQQREYVLGTSVGAVGQSGTSASSTADALLERIHGTLARRGQAILYGPPGTGKTWHARRYAEWATSHAPTVVVEWVTFHPSYSYEDFVEGFRPESRDGRVELRLRDGIFKQVCTRAAAKPDNPHLLIIDEINRANVAKVFGELITLIEQDKRGTLAVRLPYSGETFTVPPNVRIIGTMNTADRSIRLLDAALRRRFGFVELMPDAAVLASAEVEGLALDLLLVNLNRRITAVVGRERQVGHSFFLAGEQPVSDPSAFARIFAEEVVPLLLEYALDDYETLAELLGSGLVDAERRELRTDVLDGPGPLVAALEEQFGARDDDAG